MNVPCGGLKESGPQREHYQEVWSCWRKCVTMEVGFKASPAQDTTQCLTLLSAACARCRTLSDLYSTTHPAMIMDETLETVSFHPN